MTGKLSSSPKAQSPPAPAPHPSHRETPRRDTRADTRLVGQRLRSPCYQARPGQACPRQLPGIQARRQGRLAVPSSALRSWPLLRAAGGRAGRAPAPATHRLLTGRPGTAGPLARGSRARPARARGPRSAPGPRRGGASSSPGRARRHGAAQKRLGRERRLGRTGTRPFPRLRRVGLLLQAAAARPAPSRRPGRVVMATPGPLRAQPAGTT